MRKNKLIPPDFPQLMDTIPPIGYLRDPQVRQIIPVSRSAWWAGVKSGKYPKPVKLSERCTAWKVEDIRNLISSYNNTEVSK